MNTATALAQSPNRSLAISIQQDVDHAINCLLATLPDPEQLSAEQRRGIISRYTSVLEGNFIYWMTGAFLSARSEQARSIILDNLREEVQDSHPNMLRKFVLAAHAAPTDLDALAVNRDLTNVRLFVGRMSAVRILTMMAFFEGFIQKFMAYLADLAARQGSFEYEYTDVHGVCDVGHTKELFRALEEEMELSPAGPEGDDLFEGVYLLRALLQNIIGPIAANHATQPIC